MELLNAIMLLFASFVIIFLVFFINFLQKMLIKEQESKFEILFFYSKNYEMLASKFLDTQKDMEDLKKEISFLRDNYIPKYPLCFDWGEMEIMPNWECERCGNEYKNKK